MGTRQIYRGDPTQKLYYVTNNFSGGINTRDVDENIYDYQFRDLVNVDLATQGIIQSRRGFKELETLMSLFVLFNISLPITDYSFIKVLNNSNNILEQIVRGESIGITWAEADEAYWSAEGIVGGDTDITITEEPVGGYVSVLPTISGAIGLAGKVYNSTDLTTHYFKQTYLYEGNLKILMITENSVQLLSYDGTTLALDVIEELPAVSSYKENFISDNVAEHVNKLYISLNGLSENYKGILIYDRDTDTVTCWGGKYLLNDVWTPFNSDLLTDVYMPKPYDISSNAAGLTQGFNVLFDYPLLYIDNQGTGLRTLRNIILCDNMSFIGDTYYLTGDYVEKIPTSGDFNINVIVTGDYKFKPEHLKIIIKDQDENYLNFKIGNISTNEYGQRNFGFISYSIQDLDLTGVSYVLITIEYQTFTINKKDRTEASLESGDFNTLNNYYAPKDELFVYKMIKGMGETDPGMGGRLLDDYSKINVDFSAYVDDVSTANPETVFSVYMTSANTGSVFQLRDADYHRTYIYTYPSTFTLQPSDGILYDTIFNFIPFNGTLIDIGDDNYYLHYDISNSKSLSTVDKTNIDLNHTVPSIEGQFYDISDGDPEEPVEGLDLEDVKLITIDNKLVYYKGNTIYFSALYQFDYVPNFAFVLLPLLSTDEIVKIKYFKGSWIIFTKYTIWKMKGTYGDADWEIQLLNDSIGCIAPKTIVSIENSLYFLSQNGLYRLVQNYYQDGLENVTKADKMIPDLIPIDSEIQGILYRDQYILYMPDEYDFDTIRMYYNIDLPDKQHPFVKDKFSVRPDNLFDSNGDLFSIKYGTVYLYDLGYTDFISPDAVSNDDYIYNITIETSTLNFGYPTHDKKIKSIYVKTKSDDPTYLYFTIWLDGYLRAQPTSFRAVLNDDEEIVYEEYIDYTKDSNLKIQLDELGELELGNGILGDNENAVHKITLGYKGKTIKLKIEQQSDANFGITNIGYLYKLGKVKEQR